MNSRCELQLADCMLWLLAEKAIYWPQQRLLCVADVHFGKAASYRSLGQPVPTGTTADNLARLDDLLARYSVQRLVFLGDFLHARQARTAATLAALRAWRARHPLLSIVLVRGNHDLHAGDPPTSLGISVVDEPLIVEGLHLRHTPAVATTAREHVLAGHVHPVIRLQGRGRQALRVPCFYTEAGCTLLPSFGAFTGGHALIAKPQSLVHVTEGTQIWPLGSHRQSWR